MNVDELRAAQAPLKARYKNEPASALVTIHANGAPEVTEQVCRVESFLGIVDAGLHPATGGDGTKACSADMLLEALVACAGVTLGAVATAMGVVILVESGLSFLGLGVPPPAPTWGGMLSGAGRTFMYQGPWLALAPGLCLTVVVYATNMFGDALRDLLDPRMRGSR